MKIDKEAVIRTAQTLKFEITDKEIDAIINQANDMISIIDSIAAIDTENTHRTNVMSQQTNVFAKYDLEEDFSQQIKEYDNYVDGYFEIKKVMEDE